MLAEVRKHVGRSQVEVAECMFTTQSAISRFERQRDWKLSTLQDYAAALGGYLRVTVECGDESIDLATAEVAAAGETTP